MSHEAVHSACIRGFFLTVLVVGPVPAAGNDTPGKCPSRPRPLLPTHALCPLCACAGGAVRCRRQAGVSSPRPAPRSPGGACRTPGSPFSARPLCLLQPGLALGDRASPGAPPPVIRASRSRVLSSRIPGSPPRPRTPLPSRTLSPVQDLES